MFRFRENKFTQVFLVLGILGTIGIVSAVFLFPSVKQQFFARIDNINGYNVKPNRDLSKVVNFDDPSNPFYNKKDIEYLIDQLPNNKNDTTNQNTTTNYDQHYKNLQEAVVTGPEDLKKLLENDNTKSIINTNYSSFVNGVPQEIFESLTANFRHAETLETFGYIDFKLEIADWAKIREPHFQDKMTLNSDGSLSWSVSLLKGVSTYTTFAAVIDWKTTELNLKDDHITEAAYAKQFLNTEIKKELRNTSSNNTATPSFKNNNNQNNDKKWIDQIVEVNGNKDSSNKPSTKIIKSLTVNELPQSDTDRTKKLKFDLNLQSNYGVINKSRVNIQGEHTSNPTISYNNDIKYYNSPFKFSHDSKMITGFEKKTVTPAPAPAPAPVPTPTTKNRRSANINQGNTNQGNSNNNLIIPDSIDGYPVERIGKDAFKNKLNNTTQNNPPQTITTANTTHNYTQVTIPASVKYIDAGAFAQNSNLTLVKFTDGKNIETIEDGAFCKNTTQKNGTNQNNDCGLVEYEGELDTTKFTEEKLKKIGLKKKGTTTKPNAPSLKDANKATMPLRKKD